MAGWMVRDPVRVVGADVRDLQPFDQELGELEDLRAEFPDLFGKTLVSCEFGCHGVELAHHAHAGARGGDDGLVAVEDLDEAPNQRYRLALVACVEVHLAAAGLGVRKVHFYSEPFEDLDGRPSRLCKERVVKASYEERHAHRYGSSFVSQGPHDRSSGASCGTG